jgi:(2R)-3-sulfolactate dehydrogenase (NADP+)
MAATHYQLADLHALIVAILVAHDTAPANAEVVARALVAAEADGQKGHGASRVPSYAGQARSGKVDGHAVPELIPLAEAAAVVDAHDGFAYPAIALAQRTLQQSLRRSPVAAVAIRNSHHTGVVAHHVEPLARAGYIAISLCNGPQAIAPWGGHRGLFGTNPIGFAAPREGAAPLVIDMSLSKVARGRINVAAQAGEPIPPDWAFDASGHPTTDASEAMAGTLAPMGDAKGAQLVLMVEILAGALSASCFGFESSSYFSAEGAPPRAGQFLLALDPGPFSQGHFADRLEVLLAAIEAQPGARLPGQRRYASRETAGREGVTIPQALHEQLLALRG